MFHKVFQFSILVILITTLVPVYPASAGAFIAGASLPAAAAGRPFSGSVVSTAGALTGYSFRSSQAREQSIEAFTACGGGMRANSQLRPGQLRPVPMRPSLRIQSGQTYRCHNWRRRAEM